MKQVMAPLAALIICATTAACGGDVCEQAYEKKQACLEALNCSTMDLTQQMQCKDKKKLGAVDYVIYKSNQEQYGFDMTCEGANKESAEGKLACTLEPQTFCEQCQ